MPPILVQAEFIPRLTFLKDPTFGQKKQLEYLLIKLHTKAVNYRTTVGYSSAVNVDNVFNTAMAQDFPRSAVAVPRTFTPVESNERTNLDFCPHVKVRIARTTYDVEIHVVFFRDL
jgi:hypothetical protein